MIAHLTGKLVLKRDDRAVLDVGGVGFEVWIPISTYRTLPREGDITTLLTFLYVREDELRLFGFATENERDLFLVLNTVQGVGGKMAMDVLSHLSVERFCHAIQNGDIALLCQVPGIGKKRAERLVFDLRQNESLALIAAGVGQHPLHDSTPLPPGSLAAEAAQALIALGTKPAVAQRAVSEALTELGEETALQELIRKALQLR